MDQVVCHEDMTTSFPPKLWIKLSNICEKGTYEISELTERGILPCINLNFIFWFFPSDGKLFILVMTSNL
jgi:hypothetical protein